MSGGLVDRIVGAESGGNPTAKNPNSSATGSGQFIDGTWLDMVGRYRPDLAGLPRDQILALRNDPALSKEMVQNYADENGARLQARGLPVTDGTKYLSHFAGPQGAIAVLSADPSTPVAQVLKPGQVAANPFVRPMTAGQLVDWASRKVGGTAPAMTTPGGSGAPGRFGMGGPTQDRLPLSLAPAGGAGMTMPEAPERPDTDVAALLRSLVGGAGAVPGASSPDQAAPLGFPIGRTAQPTQPAPAPRPAPAFDATKFFSLLPRRPGR